MTQPIYAIYGASGFGREVMYIAREQVIQNDGTKEQLIFVDDNPQNSYLNGHKVITYDELMSLKRNNVYIALAIADSSIRQTLAERISADGLQPWQIIYKNVVLMDEIEIGEGSILSPFVTITSNIEIGKFFHANIYCYIGHDCKIGHFVTFAPSVKCNGNIVIEDHAYIGTGAIIRQGKPNKPLIIGEGATVAMGAVVTKNVPAGATVIGNPAIPLSKRFLRKKT